MKNQPNKATVKDGLPTAEEVLKSKVPSALYNSGNCYVGHALDAMQSYSDQQNAELTQSVNQLQRLLDAQMTINDELRERVKELEGALEKISTPIHGEYPDIVTVNWIAKEALKQQDNETD